MPCVFRATGSKKAVRDFMARHGDRRIHAFYKGEPRFPARPDGPKIEISGLGMTASKAGFADLKRQISDSIRYLKTNKALIQAMARLGLKGFRLDFGIRKRDVEAQYVIFPARLLLLAGQLGVSIEISQYAMAD